MQDEGSALHMVTIVEDPVSGDYGVARDESRPETEVMTEGPLAGLTVTHAAPGTETASSPADEFPCLFSDPNVQAIKVAPLQDEGRNWRYDWWVHPYVFDNYDEETNEKLLVACTIGGTRATRNLWYLWHGGVAVSYPDASRQLMATKPEWGTGQDLASVEASLSLDVGVLSASVSQKATGVNGGATGGTPSAAASEHFADNSAYAYWKRAGFISPGSDSFQGQVLHTAWLLPPNERVLTPLVEPYWLHWCPHGLTCLVASKRST